jgi:hypothetical protein
MPTGYTANVKDGISFEQFVWQCSRAMGAMIMMRDEPSDAPIPERFEPSDWNENRHKEAVTELARLQALTPQQAQAECEADYVASERSKEKRLAENEAQLAAYEAMLCKVKEWTPPTKDHEGFKEFMVSQLTESIRFDDSRDYLKPSEMPAPDEWLAAKIAKARRDIEYHSKAYQEEVERTEARNEWLAALRASLNA